MRNQLDENLEKGIVFLFIGAGLILRFLVLLIPLGLTQCRFRHNKTDITIIIIALITTPFTALYLSSNIMVITVIYILTVLTLRGLVFSFYKFNFDSSIKHCGIMSDNNKYPRLKAVKHENLSKIFVLNSSIPRSKFIMQVSKLSNSLNTNIINISLINNKSLIVTNKKENINPDYLKLEKFKTVFDSLELDIKIKDHEDTEYYTNIFFNTEIYKSKLLNVLPEIEHRLKIENLELMTDQKFDFKLSMKKRIDKVLTFLANWDLNKEKIDKLHIPIMIGTNTETGLVTLLDLTKDCVHGIVAGSSGYGKSVELHNICSSIVLSNRKYIKLVLCDPKKNELKLYRSLDRVTYANTDQGILDEVENCVIEMDRRNNLFEPFDSICDITDWNNNNPSKKLDHIILIIDEIADFMQKSNSDISKRFKIALERLLQLGRSTGFILFLTTQNPIKEVITSIMKANIETRFGFTTTDKRKSLTILDNNLAYSLNEKGKFVFQNKKQNIIHKSFFISENEKIEIVERVKLYKNKVDKIENNIVSLEKSEIEEIEREIENQIDKIEINNTQNLYNFYINIQLDNGELPNRHEIMNQTTLTEWQLRKLNEELKEEGKLITKGNKLKVLDELKMKRYRKKG